MWVVFLLILNKNIKYVFSIMFWIRKLFNIKPIITIRLGDSLKFNGFAYFGLMVSKVKCENVV